MKILLCLLFIFVSPSVDFKQGQLKNERVRIAYSEKLPQLRKTLNQQNLDLEQLQLYIRAFKAEKTVEIWIKNKADKTFRLFQNIPFCAVSGKLGPKSEQGDGQIPEGFYVVNRFHPESKYFLSLGLNYPNAADLIRNKTDTPGSNIFIHGKCATIGCIPITDDRIKELYILAVEAHNNGQEEIPVHIFPARLITEKMEMLEIRYSEKEELLQFWRNLKTGYDYFETRKTLPEVLADANGSYVFK